jgi:hypothetical protein
VAKVDCARRLDIVREVFVSGGTPVVKGLAAGLWLSVAAAAPAPIPSIRCAANEGTPGASLRRSSGANSAGGYRVLPERQSEGSTKSMQRRPTRIFARFPEAVSRP